MKNTLTNNNGAKAPKLSSAITHGGLSSAITHGGTTFRVTETYLINCTTEHQAWDAVTHNDFTNADLHCHRIKIEPNF